MFSAQSLNINLCSQRDQLSFTSILHQRRLVNKFNASQKVCFSAVVSCENQEEGLIGKNYNVKMFMGRGHDT